MEARRERRWIWPTRSQVAWSLVSGLLWSLVIWEMDGRSWSWRGLVLGAALWATLMYLSFGFDLRWPRRSRRARRDEPQRI